MCQCSDKKVNFDFFGPNLPKNRFWGQNFKALSLDSKSGTPRYHVCQFSVKTGNFKFFGLNLVKLSITCDILVLITLRVLQRARWTLKSAGWRWVEVSQGWNELGGAGWRWRELGGAGWRWMELGGAGWRWRELGGAGCTVW